MAEDTPGPAACPQCGRSISPDAPQAAGWMPPAILAQLERDHPGWRRPDGTCHACVRQALLQTLLAAGDIALHDRVQALWPLDAEAVPAFLAGEVSDETLRAGLAMLKAGRFPGWRLVGEADYIATRAYGAAPSPGRFRKLWLEDGAGRGVEVILEQMPGPPIWQRRALPGERRPGS